MPEHRERKLSTGRTSAEEADFQATGRRPVWERAGMSEEEYRRGKAQLAEESRRARMRAGQSTDRANGSR